VALATIISACTFVAAALAVAGLIVLIVMLAIHHNTPIEDFAQGAAKDDGYYMPLDYDIESFRSYQPKGAPSLAAVTVGPTASAGQVLHLAADGTLSYAPPDRTMGTGFFLLLDGEGHARLCSLTNSSPQKALCLALDSTSKQLTTVPLDKSDSATSQLWTATLLSAPTMSTTAKVPTSGSFHLCPVDDGTLALDLSGPVPLLSATNASVALTMTTIAPTGLTMADAVLSTTDRDRVFSPRLALGGSTPLTWSVSPAPPAWLLFDPTTGTFNQPLGQGAPLTPATTFTMTADNGVGRVQAPFTITVKAPALVGA